MCSWYVYMPFPDTKTICLCKSIELYTYIYTYAYACIHMYVYIYIDTHKKYIHVYSHTWMHTSVPCIPLYFGFSVAEPSRTSQGIHRIREFTSPHLSLLTPWRATDTRGCSSTACRGVLGRRMLQLDFVGVPRLMSCILTAYYTQAGFSKHGVC